MGAFSFVIDTILFLQCGLTFGSNFSPANWEPICHIAEQLAMALFNNNTLQEKHKHHLDKLQWDISLGNHKRRRFTPAARDSQNPGVRLPDGLLRPTPHHLFVNDDIYADIFDSYPIQQAVVASIEAIYILLGDSDLSQWQDPILFDKLEDIPISFSSRILGQIVNMWQMDVEAPPEFIADTIRLLQKSFSPHWKVFRLQDIESLTGKLGHIASTAPWLRFLLPDLYAEIAWCLNKHKNHLTMTNKQVRNFIKLHHDLTVTHNHQTFAIAKTAKAVHML